MDALSIIGIIILTLYLFIKESIECDKELEEINNKISNAK